MSHSYSDPDGFFVIHISAYSYVDESHHSNVYVCNIMRGEVVLIAQSPDDEDVYPKYSAKSGLM